MKIQNKWVIFWATGCGSGSIPFAPGTFGTLAGLPLCYLLTLLPFYAALFCMLAFMPLAAHISTLAERILAKKDPGAIVIDEIAGIMLTLFALPFNWLTVIAGFLIFRFLDILKPFQIQKLEKIFPGGWGVLMDDVAAGILANIILRIIILLL